MSTETTNTPKSSNIVSLEKVKNACFGAKTSLPMFCQCFAQESLSTTDDFSEAERQFDCTDALLKISETQAKQEVKQAKLNAMLRCAAIPSVVTVTCDVQAFSPPTVNHTPLHAYHAFQLG